MQDVRSIDTGVDTDISTNWSTQIAGILIDNPSNSWLWVEPLSRYVPPQTIGWSANFRPTTTRVIVKFVDGPSGGYTSSNTGGPVKISVFDYNVGENPGSPYTVQAGIVTLSNDIGDLRTDIQDGNNKLDTVIGYTKPLSSNPVTSVVAIGTTPTLIRAATQDEAWLFQNNDNNVSIFLGDEDVATSGSHLGFELKPKTELSLDVSNGVAWYAIATQAVNLTLLWST